MAHTGLVTFVAISGVYLASCVHRIYVNYQNAVRTGFPVVLCPVNTINTFYMILQEPLRILLKPILPTAIYERWHPATYGWEFRDRHGLHDRIGPVFVLVTSGINELWCADPGLAQIILARRKDFVTLPAAKMIMSLLGNNVIASDGEDWARQRRLIAPNLNEKISAVVWKESMAQADQMADFVLGEKDGITFKTISSLRAIAINVLGRVGYGQPKKFQPMELPRDPAAPMAYIDAIGLVAELLAVAAIVPSGVLSLPIMPKVLQTLGAGMRRLPSLTADMLDQERQRQKTLRAEDSDGRENIMSMLLRLADATKSGGASKQEAADPHSTLGLTEDEIAGNLFLVTGAGFDTTANTMAFAAILMAIYPDKQRWVQEELDRVFGSVAGLTENERNERLQSLDYTTVYPQLVRTLAFMCETLRLFPPVIHISRAAKQLSADTSYQEKGIMPGAPQTVTIHNRTHPLQGSFNVFVNNMALHTSHATWGDDADEFRPERFIIDSESLYTPPRGTFNPWSGGPRVCPGQKMSQVEFVVVMATLLWRCTVRPVVHTEKGETEAGARERLFQMTQDSQPRLTLQLNDPDNVELQWVAR